MSKRKKFCVVNQQGKKWLFNEIEYYFNEDDETGLVIGVMNDKTKVELLEMLGVEDKQDLKANFYDAYCVKKLDAKNASEECKKIGFEPGCN